MAKSRRNAGRASSSRAWLWLFGLAAALSLLFIGLWRSREPAKLDAAELVRLKNLANARLENGDYALADPLYSQLTARLPHEPLGYRNLAICRLSAQQQQGNENERSGAEKTKLMAERLSESLTTLLKQEPESAATYVLIARAGMLLDERGFELSPALPGPHAALKRATQLEPKNAAIWYELADLAQTAKYAADMAAQEAAKVAIAKAYDIDPRNLAVLRRYLATLAQSKNPKLADALKSARDTLAPLRVRVEQQTKGDLESFRQKALAAAEAEDWPAAMGACRVLDNLLAPQEAQKSDLRRVSLFALEFMRQDFEPEFYRRHVIATSDTKPTKVAFQSRDLKLPQEFTVIHDLQLVDVDLDEKLDLVALAPKKLSIFKQTGDSNSPTWELLAEITLPIETEQILIGDLDRDVPKLPAACTAELPSGLKQSIECEIAYPDFVLYGANGVTVVKQAAGMEAGERRLEVVTQTEGLEKISGVITALLADWDHDGDLDLVLREPSRIGLWRHLGNLQFDDVSSLSDLPAGGGEITTMVAADVDHDLDLDILCNGPNADDAQMLENLRHGQFRVRQLGKPFAALGASEDFVVADLDGNGSWDVLTPEVVILTDSPHPSVWNARAPTKRDAHKLHRLLLGDFDNDSWMDLALWGEEAQPGGNVRLYRGGLGGKLEDWRIEGVDIQQGLSCVAVGDVDSDGDLDLVYASQGSLKLLTNNGGNTNPWLQVRIAGRADEKDRVNATGIGSTIEVKTGERYQAQLVTRQPIHFGLGPAKQADVCRILFTNGVPQVRIQPPANQQFCEKMELLSSCPFLYTWTGERFEFYTDLLWAAPLGLQVTEGNVMPDRPWEYLKIDGDRCLPKDGEITLQITGELWEADYFDEVKLFAVDHPADVQIFTNEKVGPPSIAEHQIHTARNPQRPVSAKNHRGRDLLPELAARDGVYCKPWDRAIRQGLVEEHYIELDLGDLSSLKQVKLFLRGWIYPTDVGLNVALDQHPDLAFPQPPAILVPDETGEWKMAMPFMGFPGGKTKTIVVDISNIVSLSPPRREGRSEGQFLLRIAMSQELYWDEIFFTVDEEPAEVRETPLELLTADLHYRGFSGDIEPEPNSPRIYDYSVVNKEPKWPPMRGKFTRYGDVRELLTDWDDKQVVLGAGDEMTVRFSALPGLPAGWKRDYVLKSVGWDKDAVLHTLYGQDSDPLPFKAMTRYPHGPEESFPDSPELREYLRKYQTREQPFQSYWRALQRENKPSPRRGERVARDESGEG